MPEQVSIDDFAARIKKAAPSLADVPNDELVRKVLQRRPQLATVLTKQPGPPAAPKELTTPDSMTKKVMDVIGQGVESTMNTPNRMGKRSRELFKQSDNLQGKITAPFRAEGEEVGNILKGLWHSTAPGMIGQPAENNIANAITMMAGMKVGEVPLREGTAPRTSLPSYEEMAGDPTKSGSLLGARTRGGHLLDFVDKAARDIPVDYKGAYEWAQKAMELEKRGFTVPKPIKDFVNWVDSRSKPVALTPKSGESNAFIDTGGERPKPLLYQHARDFEKALGAKIPWDADAGGVMTGISKKMREALGVDTAKALKPHGLDVHYLRGKADLAKAYAAKEKFGPIGKIAGKVAGYGTGTVTGHPLILGYGGGLAGESAANRLVKSITEHGSE